MKIIVFGGDGFCGWPTALRLASAGNEVIIVDNLSRRAIDDRLSSNSLTNISSIKDRVAVANELVGAIQYRILDVADDYFSLKSLLHELQPDAVVQFAEQRSAPYSMLGDIQRQYTVSNNINSTHNICSALVEVSPKTHLVHLGTMGVYGYSKDFGVIPEGYLNVRINQTKKDVDILYPANPGSIYHMTKCLDQLVFQYYNKNWGIKITDLHQGIVWGIETKETKIDPTLVNRFDYDGIYGTVLNRFISQAANGQPLSIYGTGGQKRAFIHISDTAECVRLAIENGDFDSSRVRIFNQASEVRSIKELAEIISSKYGSEVRYLNNPRNEMSENDLELNNEGLKGIGFSPILLNESLIDDVRFIAAQLKGNFRLQNVLTSPKWVR